MPKFQVTAKSVRTTTVDAENMGYAITKVLDAIRTNSFVQGGTYFDEVIAKRVDVGEEPF